MQILRVEEPSLAGDLEDKIFKFSPQGNKFSCSIGSSGEVDISLTNAKTVKPSHALFAAYSDGFYLVEHAIDPDWFMYSARHVLSEKE